MAAVMLLDSDETMPAVARPRPVSTPTTMAAVAHESKAHASCVVVPNDEAMPDSAKTPMATGMKIAVALSGRRS